MFLSSQFFYHLSLFTICTNINLLMLLMEITAGYSENRTKHRKAPREQTVRERKCRRYLQYPQIFKAWHGKCWRLTSDWMTKAWWERCFASRIHNSSAYSWSGTPVMLERPRAILCHAFRMTRPLQTMDFIPTFFLGQSYYE
jgi:hypothetical protein